MLSCEFSEIFKNNFIYKTPMVAGFFKYVFLSTEHSSFCFTLEVEGVLYLIASYLHKKF